MKNEVLELNKSKDDLTFKRDQLKRQLEDDPTRFSQPASEAKKDQLNQTIGALEKLNALKKKEIERNRELLESLEKEYRDHLDHSVSSIKNPSNLNRLSNQDISEIAPASNIPIPTYQTSIKGYDAAIQTYQPIHSRFGDTNAPNSNPLFSRPAGDSMSYDTPFTKDIAHLLQQLAEKKR